MYVCMYGCVCRYVYAIYIHIDKYVCVSVSVHRRMYVICVNTFIYSGDY